MDKVKILIDFVGKNIKKIARFVINIGIGASIIFWLISLENNHFYLSMAILFFGSISSVVSGVLLYGIGSLIDDAVMIRSKLDSKKYYK